MSTSKIFHCIVDDTALITNISEIEAWVVRGSIALVVPLHTLERLHLLKKDNSQIGQNARKAVKFLDDATSNPEVKVFIQEPDDQYETWAQVEAHYIEATDMISQRTESHKAAAENGGSLKMQEAQQQTPLGEERNAESNASNKEEDIIISKSIRDKLTISKDPRLSPVSTPPLSPSSSGPQSTKTSPEVTSASLISNDLSPVPPTLKALINPVVWYSHEKQSAMQNVIFLTNSSDAAYLARDFGVSSKNIHQLRASIGVEEQEAKNHDKYQKKHASKTPAKPSSEPKTLFKYEEDESEEEVVVFKPRNRGSMKPTHSARNSQNNAGRNRSHGHSPANSLSGPLPSPQPKPQIPTEEIDPDSFDRGSFARGSMPLVSVGNHAGGPFHGPSRSPPYRNSHLAATTTPSRGHHHRGSSRGADRGSARGRGRLFVP